MSLPVEWVEELFARLFLRYGMALKRAYDGMDMDLVKADWGQVLSGFARTDIRFALDNLPAQFPPNAMEFRAICRRAPAVDVPQLPAPKADPAVVAKALAAIKPTTPKGSLAQQCIDRIVAIHGPHPTNAAVRHVLESCRQQVGGRGLSQEELTVAG
jgi:hypothetical protein